MGRKSSPWATGLAAAGLLAVLLVGYVGAYWSRLPCAIYIPSGSTGTVYGQVIGERNLYFPSTFESVAFSPASWMHERVHEESLLARCADILTRYGHFQLHRAP